MDKREALQIAGERSAVLRTWPYDKLVSTLLDREETEEVTAPSGVTYQVETQAFWDDKPGGDLRVIVWIDDGGLRAFVPRSVGFIMAPDGTFVDDD